MSVTVKITVAEPSVIIRSGIIAVIGSAENLKAEIYEVSEIDQLRNVLSWQHPDILLVNPASLGLFPLQQLKKDTGNPDMKCVALQFAFTDHAALKSYDDAISVYDSAETVNDKLARLVSEPERDKRHESLSGREKEVIACVVQGMTNKQIADKLFISTHTVITHRRNISAKLGIHSPAGLTIYAIVNKLVELDARPSDALMMAVRFGTAIKIVPSVWESMENMLPQLEQLDADSPDSRAPVSVGDS